LVGCEPGRSYGRLISALRETPDAVVLLDEFEKAHGDVHKKFLTSWNDGYVTEASDGRQVSTTPQRFHADKQRRHRATDRDRPTLPGQSGRDALCLHRRPARRGDWSRVMATPERLARATQIRDWAAAWWPLVERGFSGNLQAADVTSPLAWLPF